MNVAQIPREYYRESNMTKLGSLATVTAWSAFVPSADQQ